MQGVGGGRLQVSRTREKKSAGQSHLCFENRLKKVVRGEGRICPDQKKRCVLPAESSC